MQENKERGQGADGADASGSRMKERLRQGSENFQFDALLKGVSTLESPDTAERAAVRAKAERQTGPPQGGWLVDNLPLIGVVGAFCIILLVGALWLRQRGPAAPASQQSSVLKSSPPAAAPAPQITGAPQGVSLPGIARVRLDPRLKSHYTYWFVSPDKQASASQPLPLPDKTGVVTLAIPAGFSGAGAQIRFQDSEHGTVASLQCVDVTRPGQTFQQQLAGNLLANGEFRRGTQGWVLEAPVPPANGTMMQASGVDTPAGAAGKVLEFNVLALGAHNWHIQAYQDGVNLADGKPYQFSFWARSDRTRPLSVDMILGRPDWHQVGVSTQATLTTSWQKFSFAFTPSHAVPNSTRVEFILGDALGLIDVADVSLREVRGAVVVKQASENRFETLTPANFN